jgi:cysteine desulfurase family protein
MIYLDNATTSFQKPREVAEAVNDCVVNYCASPGRGGHKPALAAARAVYSAREAAAGFFNIDDPLRVIFTSGATESLNLAIKGTLKSGDHVVTTSMEHNSVLRPLSALKEKGVDVTIVPCRKDGLLDVKDIENSVKANTKMVICAQVSNLTGAVMPIDEIGGICKKHGILFLVDAAQSAGVFGVDVRKSHIDLLAIPGHKGIMGLPGAGMLYIGKSAEVTQLKEGGTGSGSEEIVQPDIIPDKYESGTMNLPGIVSVSAGLEFINKTGIEAIREHEKTLADAFLEGVRNMSGVTVYGHTDESAAIIALNLDGVDPSELAFTLDNEFGICARAGLHCAPYAHKTIGTQESGAVRFSIGYFNTKDEILKTVDAIYGISKIKGGANGRA